MKKPKRITVTLNADILKNLDRDIAFQKAFNTTVSREDVIIDTLYSYYAMRERLVELDPNGNNEDFNALINGDEIE